MVKVKRTLKKNVYVFRNLFYVNLYFFLAFNTTYLLPYSLKKYNFSFTTLLFTLIIMIIYNIYIYIAGGGKGGCQQV